MIPGISDVKRLPRLGKIRLGEKRIAKSGKEYPAALDRFDFRDVPEVEEVYGKNCREIDIVLPTNDINVFFPQAREAWRAGGLFCRCSDGVTATRVRVEGAKDKLGEAHLKNTGEEVEVGKMYRIPCEGEDCHYFDGRFCKNVGRLLVMLPKVKRFGCYEIDTSSRHGMVGLNSYIHSLMEAAHRVSMIPLKLRLIPREVSPDGKKKTVQILDMYYENTLQSLLDLRRKALPPPVPPEQMPPAVPPEGPDDLMPEGGEALDKKLDAGGADKPWPQNAPEPEDRGRAATDARAALKGDGEQPEMDFPGPHADKDESGEGYPHPAGEPKQVKKPAGKKRPW